MRSKQKTMMLKAVVNSRRALRVTALILAVGLSLSLYASTHRAGQINKGAATAVEFQPVRLSAPATLLPDSFYIDCPADAHVGVVDLPPEWFNLFVGNYHWKDIVIVRNQATKRIEVSCVYKDNFSMTRSVSLNYSCERLDPGNAFSARVRCDLKPSKPPRPRRP